MIEITASYPELFQKWKTRQLSEEAIKEELIQFGVEELHIPEILHHYKKKCCDDRQTTGFVLTGIGSFLGFISCLFTMLDLVPELRGFMLYGLTSIGLVVIFIGLYLIFEE